MVFDSERRLDMLKTAMEAATGAGRIICERYLAECNVRIKGFRVAAVLIELFKGQSQAGFLLHSQS
jgi:hypothetical protein